MLAAMVSDLYAFSSLQAVPLSCCLAWLCAVLSSMPSSERSSLVKYHSDPVHPLIKLALAYVSLHKSSLTFLGGLINYALLQSVLLKQCLIY